MKSSSLLWLPLVALLQQTHLAYSQDTGSELAKCAVSSRSREPLSITIHKEIPCALLKLDWSTRALRRLQPYNSY